MSHCHSKCCTDSYVLPRATEHTLGGVRIDGDSIKIDCHGVIYTEAGAEAHAEVVDERRERINQDTLINARIDNEIAERAAADGSIRADMGSLDDLDTTDKTSLVNAINEVKQSSGGDIEVLTQRVAAEEATRANADVALGNRIDSEEAARAAADTALSTRINNENTERQAVTGNLTDLMTDDQTNLVAAINEVDTNADVAYALADAADTKVGDLTDLETDVKTSAVAAINDNRTLTILVRDQLRQEVEAASGGKRTVLRNSAGEPSVMNIIPMFTLNTINSAWPNEPHPAFIVDDVVKTEMFIGSFQADAANTSRLVSLPHKSPMNYVNMDQAITRGRAGGPGWHCMTNAEWAAVALLAHKADIEVRGNGNYGRDVTATWETGTLDGRNSSYGGFPGAVTKPGDTSKWCPTLTGSGPASWSHDGTPFGIMDLCGNVWEWTIGVRIVYGEIHILVNNDAALATADLSATSTAWKAIKEDGTFVTPDGSGTTEGTLKLDGESANTGIRFNTTVQYQYTGDTDRSKLFSSVEAATGITVPNILKFLGISPVSGDTYKRPGYTYLRNQYPERCPCRGGSWRSGVDAGMFALNLSGARSDSYNGIGARPTFIA